jgi:hypothetical protein
MDPSCTHGCDKKDASVGTSDSEIKFETPEEVEYVRTAKDDLYLHAIVCIVIVLVTWIDD